MLSQGASVNKADDTGKTALHCAAQNNQCKCINTLHRFGADLEARETRNFTALHWAALKDHPESIQTLVSLGADVSATVQGSTALDLAVNNGRKECADLLWVNNKEKILSRIVLLQLYRPN